MLLIQKSILRDAVNDLALHYLSRAKIMVVTDVEREDVEFIYKTLGCKPVATPEQLDPSKLGHAELVEVSLKKKKKIERETEQDGLFQSIGCRLSFFSLLFF